MLLSVPQLSDLTFARIRELTVASGELKLKMQFPSALVFALELRRQESPPSVFSLSPTSEGRPEK
jgi:hypothetical protein